MTDVRTEGGDIPAPGEATTDRVRGIFGRIAGSYDTFNLLSSLGIDRLWRRSAVTAAALQPGARVLDLCAGTGDLAFALAATGAPGEVVVSDFSPEMLAVAERKAQRLEGSVHLSFLVADAQDIPFADESFDVVTVAFGVRNLPDRAANFAEVRRILRPGGRYVILEFSRPPFPPWRGLYHAYLRIVIPLLGSMLSGGDRASFQYLNDSIRRFPAQEALAAELRRAGFSAIDWKNRTGGIVAVHTAVR
ncbi:MAG: bifunctional demethylmenaquinone methyltransferase/2-methoxy-6-polyprenyl-1,4-benzoquinol methylase UbiE [Coriobacteriia bacterium]|nr:bifunctional demethylmenaquinone methyltransferase/2-methoxy-6-polyprenyl-1,4-benzoquinol methylase UbiE [Coriobacteriia bacterium]